MRTAALVPVGDLGHAKTRLSPALTRKDAARLCLTMLDDVLAALAAVDALHPVAVATHDARVAARAQAAGARVLAAPPGLNPAVASATRTLATEGAEAVLVVLGDVAGVLPDDLRALLAAGEALGGPGVVLAPSDDGGSSALLRRPPDVVPVAFGPGSAAAHRAAAERRGVPFRTLALPSLATDLDVPADLEVFAAGGPGGAGTHALLRELGVEAARG